MFLVKCKCGGIFTVMQEKLGHHYPNCPNCGVAIPLTRYTSVARDDGIFDFVQSVKYIPDDAKITVTFDA